MEKVRQSVWKYGSVISGAAWLASYIGARALAEQQHLVSRPTLIFLMLVPLFPGALFLYFFITDMRQMDELQRRIQLEGLAFAFPLASLLIMTLGLLQLVMELNPADWSFRHVWQYLMLFYVFGIFMAARRYK